MANLITKINTGTVDDVVGGAGVEYIDFSEGNDRLIFSKGNATVADGQPIPSQQQYISAGVHTGVETIVDKYFLEDASAGIISEISLMGNQDSQYVLAFEFDGATASEPVLEVWDDSALTTILNPMLGGGTPSSSFIRGITTTTSPSGVNWASGGTKMAGSGSGNFLWLNDQNGALTIATTLYANLAVIVPASAISGFGSNPVFSVKWLSN